jgi:transcriptional regulator with XRE-family HTH domain
MAGEVGKVLKRLREQAHLRQADLSKACGVKQPNLSRIEKGRCEPRHSTLLRIAEALGTSVEAIEAEAARLSAAGWPGARGSSEAAAGQPDVRTMVVPVFDSPDGSAPTFDAEDRPQGAPVMSLELPLVAGRVFACRVRGDAMSSGGRDGFADGDIAVFAQVQPRNGDFAFVRTAEAGVFRQIYFEAQGLRLVPLNRAHEERLLPAGEALQAWKLVQHLRAFE